METADRVLQQAAAARGRLQAILDDLDSPMGFDRKSLGNPSDLHRRHRRYEGSRSRIRGWLANRRSSGKIHFLQMRDGSGFVQAVMSKAAVGDEVFAIADHLSQESAIIVTGTVRAEARAPGGFELDVSGLEVVSAAHEYPITPRSMVPNSCSTAGTCGSARRDSTRCCAFATRSSMRSATTSTAVVSSSRTRRSSRRPPARARRRCFRCPYFDDQTAYLTQSGQLCNEANAMALGRVYCFGPTFRAREARRPIGT